jgi:superfamily I DNA and/or RNA helicase
MAPCPNLFVSCSLATSKLILCGDFYQLSPIAESKKSKWLTLSIFDNIGITDTVAHGKELPYLSMLKKQYRCHPNIANSIIDIVYKGRLENGLESNDKNFYAYKMEPYSNYSCILLDTSNVSTQADPWCEQKGSSWINEKSADLSLKLMKDGLRSGIKSIGIITPYNAQAKLIRNKLTDIRNEYPDRKIEAATVHKYQGREMDMIIFDLPDGPSKYGLAPFLVGLHGSEAMRLINVATTRAKGKLIVVANVDFICQKLYTQKNYRDHILYQWIQYLKSQKHVMYGI